MVIRLRMNAADLQRMRFAYSPLAEVTKSLDMIAHRQVPELHRAWFESIRGRLGHLDMPLLRAVLPPGPDVARFMFVGAADAGTTIEQQLRLVASYPADCFRRDLHEVWPAGLPPAADKLLADGPGRLADELWKYW